jgi:hypothetical protein
LADLLEAKYGEQNAVTFVEKKIVPTTNELVSDAFQLALRQGRDPKFIVERILKGEVLHPQILALWLRRHTDFYGATSTVAMDSARRIASLSLRDSLTSGEFFDAFIDDVSASAFVDQTPGARDPLPAAKNPIAYNITHQKVNETGQKVGAPILDRLLISDPISLQHNITICITGGSTSAECETVNLEWLHKNRAYIDGDIFRETTTPVWAPSIEVSSSSLFLNNTSKLSDDIDEWMDDMENLDLSANPLSAVGNHGDDFPFNWTLGIDCIESIAYVDAAGFAVRITPGKNVAFVLDREIDADQLAQISRCLQNQEAELIFPDMKK